MRAYSSMPTSDFVAQLRDIAIKAGARPLVIDQLDAIVDAPSEDEIDERINEAVDAAEKAAFGNGKEDGLADKDNAVQDAEQAMYDACVAAVEAKGAEIGLTKEQVYKVVNHILWDCRP
jgi:hypothetical protein